MELGNDGTSNYSRDFPICCISIALIYNDEIVLGLINDFNRGDIYESTINLKAKLNGYEIQVSSVKETSQLGLPLKAILIKILSKEGKLIKMEKNPMRTV